MPRTIKFSIYISSPANYYKRKRTGIQSINTGADGKYIIRYVLPLIRINHRLYLIVVCKNKIFGIYGNTTHNNRISRAKQLHVQASVMLHEKSARNYKNSFEAAKRNGLGYNLLAGANIAGFECVAKAMLQQGVF